MRTIQPSDVPVVIFAGGYGSRLGEITEKIPKPMVKIGREPILNHIISLWHRAGFRKFIVLGGYKISVIQQYLIPYYTPDVKLVNTGEETQTGGRLLCIKDLLPDVFCASYGDGLTNFPLGRLLEEHQRFSSIATMMVTHPISRFGEVKFDDYRIVTKFDEKPVQEAWINAGFFVFDKEIFDYIETENDVLESDVFPRLVNIRNLQAVENHGWWHCMDTPKDVKELNKLWQDGCAPWR
jgi:glucose-1-phosphate cytidylyltransferase